MAGRLQPLAVSSGAQGPLQKPLERIGREIDRVAFQQPGRQVGRARVGDGVLDRALQEVVRAAADLPPHGVQLRSLAHALDDLVFFALRLLGVRMADAQKRAVAPAGPRGVDLGHEAVVRIAVSAEVNGSAGRAELALGLAGNRGQRLVGRASHANLSVAGYLLSVIR